MKNRKLEKIIRKRGCGSVQVIQNRTVSSTGDGLHIIVSSNGKTFRQTAKYFADSGYDVKALNAKDPKHSHCFNPLDYCMCDDGMPDTGKIRGLSGSIAKPLLQDKNGWYWKASSEVIISACIAYLLEFRPPEERSLSSVLRLILEGKPDTYSPGNKTRLDERFKRAHYIQPEAQCFPFYDIYKLAPERTANSVLVSAALALMPFSEPDIQNCTTTEYLAQSRSSETHKIRKYLYDKDRNPIRTEQNIVPAELAARNSVLYIIPGKNDGITDIVVPFLISEIMDCAEKTCASVSFYFGCSFSDEFSIGMTDIAKFVQCSEKRLSPSYGYNLAIAAMMKKQTSGNISEPDEKSGKSYRQHLSNGSAGASVRTNEKGGAYVSKKTDIKPEYKNEENLADEFSFDFDKTFWDQEESAEFETSEEEMYRKKNSITAAEKTMLKVIEGLNRSGKNNEYLHEIFFAGFALNPKDSGFYTEAEKCEKHIEKLLDLLDDKECLESFSEFKKYPYQIRCKALYLVEIDLRK